MEAKDLMIDDWVYNEVPCYITAIYSNGTMDCQGDGWAISTDRVDPIPLTAEILEKNGFEKRDGEYQDVFYHYEDFDLLIDDRLEPCGYTLYGVLELQIKYLHQLQHALRLAGIDKEIEL